MLPKALKERKKRESFTETLTIYASLSVFRTVVGDALSMTSYIIEKLRKTADQATQGGQCLTSEMKLTINQVRHMVLKYEAAWSGSQIGYQANVYYKDFNPPPPGHHFSMEWGIISPGFVQGSIGDWKEYSFQDVIAKIQRDAGDRDLAGLKLESSRIKDLFLGLKDSFDSLLTLTQNTRTDPYIDEIRAKSNDLSIPTLEGASRSQHRAMPRSTRDPIAGTQGTQTAPHQELWARFVVLQAPFDLCLELAKLCNKLADHTELLEATSPTTNSPSGSKVFIGHGRSQEWRKLKDYLAETLSLECDEFNRVPISGVTNIDRLNAMLDDAKIAIVVMTAEDEIEGGAPRARENVIHEAGLFQGRLGFEKTILLSERGCSIFSNIDGLGRIEFSRDNIHETFEKVRAVLVREMVIRN